MVWMYDGIRKISDQSIRQAGVEDGKDVRWWPRSVLRMA